MNIWLKVLILCIAVVKFSEGSGIRCYSCSSTSESRCGDDFGLTSPAAVDCQGTCIKRRGKRDNAGVSVVEVTRGCIKQTDEKCYDTSYNGISVYACTCNSNYCNNAPYATTYSPLAILSVITSSILLMY